MNDTIPAWHRALTCEVAWLAAGGQVGAVAAVPLEWEGLLCVALPYSFAANVASLREARTVVFSVTEPMRRAGEQARGFAAGTARVVDDVSGETFQRQLLTQELLKYPPSRVLADSMLVRRENWWWLPRIIVTMSRVDRSGELAVRSDPSRAAMLLRPEAAGLAVDIVEPAEYADWRAPRVRLCKSDGTELGGVDGPALAFGHDYSKPDLERWEPWSVRGTLRGDELLVADREGEPGASLRPLGLFQRMRRQRALERACRQGIAAAERDSNRG